MDDQPNREGASRRNQDLDREPKESTLPVTAAIGAVGAMLVCCLAPILFLSGASGFAAWFGGIDPLLAAGIAVVIGAVIILFRRMRKTALSEAQRAPSTTTLKGDQ